MTNEAVQMTTVERMTACERAGDWAGACDAAADLACALHEAGQERAAHVFLGVLVDYRRRRDAQAAEEAA